MIFQTSSNSRGLRGRVIQARGFTLLELVIVLGMIGVIITWLTVVTSTVETEERLRRATGDITAVSYTHLTLPTILLV